MKYNLIQIKQAEFSSFIFTIPAVNAAVKELQARLGECAPNFKGGPYDIWSGIFQEAFFHMYPDSMGPVLLVTDNIMMTFSTNNNNRKYCSNFEL
jgi:hypothetical protein